MIHSEHYLGFDVDWQVNEFIKEHDGLIGKIEFSVDPDTDWANILYLKSMDEMEESNKTALPLIGIKGLKIAMINGYGAEARLKEREKEENWTILSLQRFKGIGGSPVLYIVYKIAG